ncbi:MAG: ABC transporter permease subunit [Clostridia bacterium]|nr:ABC transporter permease subunit [Clostridia bacterium]
MSAIFKREMRAYFTSPIGFIFVAIFFIINGALFSYFTLQAGSSSDISNYFLLVLFLFIILIPLLTMKLFCEERKQKTEQLLLTAPISLIDMVGAKFFAAYIMFAGTFLASAVCNLIPYFIYCEDVNLASILGNIVGILLIGGAFVAIGMFVSALTENQFVAAITTMAVIAFLLFINFANAYIGSAPVRVVLSWISIFARFFDFTYGILNLSSLLYYASVMFIFLFLTVRVYENRRWS